MDRRSQNGKLFHETNYLAYIPSNSADLITENPNTTCKSFLKGGRLFLAFL